MNEFLSWFGTRGLLVFVFIGALEAGSEWIEERVKSLERNRRRAIEALSPVGKENVIKSEGAIYLWAKLPRGLDDQQVVETLVKEFKVRAFTH